MTLSKKEGGLGYKDLHSFNIAMLAKQGWRMLTNDKSLCVRVLKAKYFPNSSILQATACTGMSYTWRSILKGIELLKAGVIKRVGNGQTIEVWKDPWIPRKWDRLPITKKGNAVISKVAEIIDPITGCWDENLVNDIFWPVDVQQILAIPLRDGMEDCYAWFYESKGIFTVKSAYKLHRQLLSLMDEKAMGESSSNSAGFNWYDIWNSPCPPNIKNFLWRIAHNSLPVNWSIQRRGIDTDPLCPMCKRFNEDGGHIFLRCKEVRHLWFELEMEEVRKKLLNCHDSKQALSIILHQDQKIKIRSIALMWNWWKVRNKINAEGGVPKLGHLKSQILRSAAEYEDAFVKVKGSQAVPELRWKPPNEDVLKINTDGSFVQDERCGGWGFVVRDSVGEVMGAGAGHLKHVADAFHAEAEACSKALQIAQYWGISCIQIETDSQLLIHALKNDGDDLGFCSVLIKEIKETLFLNFQCFGIVYCPRSCNRVADILAAYGANLGNGSQSVWQGYAPDIVNAQVASDLAEPV